MKELFEVAAGSVTGTEHLRIGKNNQDAYYSLSSEQVTIAVVCDGCGSSRHSEVGAKIGARLVVEAIAQLLPEYRAETFWHKVQQYVLNHLHNLAQSMGGSLSQTVSDYFLFTIVGALLTPTCASVFALGDGKIIVNDKAIELASFPGNAPPYLAYGLLDSSLDRWQLQVHQELAIDQVASILIGTDGVDDLINASECNLPGKLEMVGEISQFWEKDRYFQNPDLIRRQLALINREVRQPDWQNYQMIKANGLLTDDTTFVVIRRRKALISSGQRSASSYQLF